MALEKIHLKSTTMMTLNDRFSGLGSAPADPPQVRVTGLNQYQTQTKNRRLAQHMSNRPGVNQAVATTPAAKKKSLKQRLGIKGRLSVIRGNAAGRGGVIRGGVIRGGVTRGARGMTRGTRGIVRTRGTWTVVNSTRGTAWQGGARGSARGGGGGGIRGGVRGVKRGQFAGVTSRGVGKRGRGGQRGGVTNRGAFKQQRGNTRGGRGRGGRGRGRGGRGGAQTSTKEELDSQLDSYMSSTKSHLDAELDSYMADN